MQEKYIRARKLQKRFIQNPQMGLSTDLAQLPSLDGEGAEDGWGDIESMSNKSFVGWEK